MSFLLPFIYGVVVITTAQLDSTRPELRLCAGSNPARDLAEIRDGEDLWQWSWLKIRLYAFRQSIIPQKQLIIIMFFKKKKKPFQRKYINFWNYFLKLFLNISTGFGYFILTAYQFNSQSMGWPDKHRSCHWRCSVKKGVLKNFTNFIGKHLWSLFLVILQTWLAATLLKRDSSTSVFLWNLLYF